MHQEMKKQQKFGKNVEYQKKEYIFLEKMITGGDKKQDLVGQIQKFFMILVLNLVVSLVFHLVIVENT